MKARVKFQAYRMTVVRQVTVHHDSMQLNYCC